MRSTTSPRLTSHAAAFLAISIAIFGAPKARAAGYQLLHVFSGGSDGGLPEGSLLQSGSTLYGTAASGGTSNLGTVYRLNTDGTGFSVLHNFTGGSSDGSNPASSLIQSGNTLYGTTYDGGSAGSPPNVAGSIFKMNTDGTGFSLLHSFTGSDGIDINSSLVQSGSFLYGTATYGESGPSGGTIFRIGTDGTGFTLLHTFVSGAGNSEAPFGTLIVAGSTVYGTTAGVDGGGHRVDGGEIFKMDTDGNNFSVLHAFTGGTGDGGTPFGSLLQSGSTLYGMSSAGGSANLGTIFQIGTDGTGFGLLHSFVGGATDGAVPLGSLIQSGSMLYGMTTGIPKMFEIGTDGSNYSILHSFAGGTDGRYTPASLILSDSTFFGTSQLGGTSDAGLIFALTVPEPSGIVLGSIAGLVLAGLAWRRKRAGRIAA